MNRNKNESTAVISCREQWKAFHIKGLKQMKQNTEVRWDWRNPQILYFFDINNEINNISAKSIIAEFCPTLPLFIKIKRKSDVITGTAIELFYLWIKIKKESYNLSNDTRGEKEKKNTSQSLKKINTPKLFLITSILEPFSLSTNRWKHYTNIIYTEQLLHLHCRKSSYTAW